MSLSLVLYFLDRVIGRMGYSTYIRHGVSLVLCLGGGGFFPFTTRHLGTSIACASLLNRRMEGGGSIGLERSQ